MFTRSCSGGCALHFGFCCHLKRTKVYISLQFEKDKPSIILFFSFLFQEQQERRCKPINIITKYIHAQRTQTFHHTYVKIQFCLLLIWWIYWFSIRLLPLLLLYRACHVRQFILLIPKIVKQKSCVKLLNIWFIWRSENEWNRAIQIMIAVGFDSI